MEREGERGRKEGAQESKYRHSTLTPYSRVYDTKRNRKFFF